MCWKKVYFAHVWLRNMWNIVLKKGKRFVFVSYFENCFTNNINANVLNTVTSIFVMSLILYTYYCSYICTVFIK
jgi:hypothetical protein